MIRMGLVHMLIKRLELNTKDLTESHNTSTLLKRDVKKSLRDDDDDDDEADAVVAKRVKIDYSPNRFIPVRVPQISNYLINFERQKNKLFLNDHYSETSIRHQHPPVAFRLS